MLNELEQVRPADIEKRSFEIITEELGNKKLIPGTEPVVKRCIHTSADFDYADNLVFSDHVIEQALTALRNGASIVTDTQMAKAGINKKRLAQYGGEVHCFMADEDVAQTAKRNGTTRAAACMDKAAAMWRDRDRREKDADGGREENEKSTEIKNRCAFLSIIEYLNS